MESRSRKKENLSNRPQKVEIRRKRLIIHERKWGEKMKNRINKEQIADKNKIKDRNNKKKEPFYYASHNMIHFQNLR